jgi:hypothetical protein
MKNTYILYGIALLAIVGILVCFVGYAIDTPQQPASNMVPPTQAVKKKSCACCDEKQKRMDQMMRQWLNEKPQEKP